MKFKMQCTDCGEVFTKRKKLLEHSRPEECCEWGNHAMAEATFRVYTPEHEAIEQARWARYRAFHAPEAVAERAAQLNDVRESGHLDDFDGLVDHLIEVHGFGSGARHRWDKATQLDMHEYGHQKIIEQAWWKEYDASLNHRED